MIGASIAIPGQTAAESGFVPSMLGGLVLWLRADLGVSLNVGNVSAWADQSGAGNNTTQATGANQPAYSASNANFNGKPTLSFTSASNHFLQGAASLLTPGSPRTLVVAVRRTGGVGGSLLHLPKSAGADAIFYLFNSQVYGDGAHAQNFSVAPTIDNTTAVALYATPNPAATALTLMRFNGAAQPLTSGALFSAETTFTSSFFVGDFSGTTQGFQGDIAEMTLWNRVLSASEYVSVEKYMGARYGVAL